MPRYNDVPKQSNAVVLGQARAAPSFLPLSFLVAAIVLMLASLACAFIGTDSGSIADTAIARLPTLTRTPLPSLTPTVLSTPIAAAMSAEVTATAHTSLSSPGHPAVPTIALIPATPSNPTPLPEMNIPPASTDASVANAPVATSPVPIALTASATPSPTDTPTVIATDTPPLPTDTPTATPLPSGWAFANVRIYPDQDEGGLLLYGNVINNTGAPQELISVVGTFYDMQGQVIAGVDNTYAYWPAYVVPSGGGVPFELSVDDIDSAADFDLNAEAGLSGQNPRQDFEFLDVNQWTEENAYCVGGRLRNPGGALGEYLLTALILYDEQDNIVNFGDYEEFGFTEVVGDQTSTFEICIDPPNQPVARYELRAWGQ